MRYTHLFAAMAILTCFNASAACPPIDPSSLWVPDDKAKHKPQFLAKAKKLNESGQCVIEGGFGRSHNKFYVTVSKTGNVRGAKILYFTSDELRQ